MGVANGHQLEYKWEWLKGFTNGWGWWAVWALKKWEDLYFHTPEYKKKEFFDEKLLLQKIFAAFIMKLGFRGRRFGMRLAIILSISLFVVLIQIISVSRLNTPNKYPWEDLLANEKEDIERRSLKTAFEVNMILYYSHAIGSRFHTKN